MARVCQVTGKAPMVGNNVSHANNRTKRRFLPNLQYRRFWVESENHWVRLRVSNAGLRIIDKNGIDAVLADLPVIGALFSTTNDTRQRTELLVLLTPRALENDDALRHIDMAIELAESTDFLYKYILRGELWADRWNLMHKMNMTQEAEAEVDERIEAYKDIPIEHNSYLYYGYRFKAQLAAERGVTLVAKDYMHMAIHSMEIPQSYELGLETAFAATHDNAAWILSEVDKATPNPDQLHWDI